MTANVNWNESEFDFSSSDFFSQSKKKVLKLWGDFLYWGNVSITRLPARTGRMPARRKK